MLIIKTRGKMCVETKFNFVSTQNFYTKFNVETNMLIFLKSINANTLVDFKVEILLEARLTFGRGMKTKIT